MFLCQLTKQNTLVPVCTKYGTIYDYHAIMNYIHQHKKDPQTNQALEERDLTKIDSSYLTQTYANDFTDDKEKLLSRLLYERDALLRVVAKVLQDYNNEEHKPLKRKKTEYQYSFHDFNEEINNCNVQQSRKSKNKQIKNAEAKTPVVVEFDGDFPNLAKHPLSKVELNIKNKVLLMHNNTPIHEFILHTKKQVSFVVWHCDLQIFFVVYSTFIDIYHINNGGYIDTWHIKHSISSLKCCSNGYYIAISNDNSQIDIFDLRKLSEDTKGFVASVDVEPDSSFAFTKLHNLLVFGQVTK
eukprot:NODE_350_length_10400_cov_0.385205.p5 type:complete len:298 gc:universal NODE_350_length_10400_cov_0.385205:2412-1519(-)